MLTSAVSDWAIGNRHLSDDRVSLSTPEEGTILQDSSKGKGVPLRGRIDELNSLRADLSLEFSQHQWLTDKMIDCGKAVGVSVGNSKDGWEKLITFAYGRDKENKAALTL